MERLLVHPKHEHNFAAQGWNSFEGVVAHFLPQTAGCGKVTVERGSVPTSGSALDVFFKLYDHGSAAWNFWLRASKARREFDNYETLARLGVPAAEAISCGEERDGLGRVRRAFIITCAVPAACTLIDFFKARPPRHERAAVIRELASIVRRLHAADFYYYDLVWRNILVSRQEDRGPKVFLIDCPRGGFARFGRARKRLRDLASLDKCAAQFCSRSERLRFLQWYSGEQKLRGKVNALARACLDYRRARWPGDWRGK